MRASQVKPFEVEGEVVRGGMPFLGITLVEGHFTATAIMGRKQRGRLLIYSVTMLLILCTYVFYYIPLSYALLLFSAFFLLHC